MARPGRSRYAHTFSKGLVKPHSEGSWRSTKRTRPHAMPHPENRLPARTSPDLAGLRVGDIIEKGLRIRISCDSCNHEALWTRGFMERRLRRLTRLTVTELGLRLRCAGCRSNYVRLWRG